MSFRFGPAEYLALVVLLVSVVIAVTPRPHRHALAMAVFGLLLGTIWDIDPNMPVTRDLFGLAIDADPPLIPAIFLFGFLLPRIVAYAQDPQGQRSLSAPRMVYEGLFLLPALPALLLMRQPWLAPRWVLPLTVAWGAALWLYFGLTADDAWLCAALFALGLVLLRLDCPWPPAIAGLLLAMDVETNLRRSLLLSEGNWATFVSRPICLALLGSVVATAVLGVVIRRRQQRGHLVA